MGSLPSVLWDRAARERPAGRAVRALCDWATTAPDEAVESLAQRAPLGALALAHRANERQEPREAARWAEVARTAEPVAAIRPYVCLEQGIASYHLGAFREALDACQQGLALMEDDPCDDVLIVAELEAQAAVSCRQLGLRSRAVEYNLSVLRRLPGVPDDPPEDTAERQLVATVRNNLGILYLRQGDPQTAVSHFEQGLALTRSSGHAGQVMVAQLVNLGKVLLQTGRADDAVGYLEEAVALAADCGEVVHHRAREGLALALRDQGRLDEALQIMLPVVAAWEARDARPLLAASLLTLGDVQQRMGDAAAEATLERARSLAESLGVLDVEVGAVEALVRCCEGSGRFEEACRWHGRLHELRRRRYDAQRSRAVEELRANHEAEAREREAERLRAQAATLEGLVADRTRSLQRRNEELAVARDQAQRASQAKSTFLAVTSHELRTPLNGVVGYVEMLLDDCRDEVVFEPAELADDLERVLQSARRLGRLIDRILTLTHLEAGEVAVQVGPVDLVRLVDEVVDPLRPLAVAADNTLQVEVAASARRTMHTDPSLLSQVIHHLLDNALRFTDGGQVQLEVVRRDDQLQITVRDSGAGLPDDAIEDLFRPFQQLDMSYTRAHEGLGLGLALCQLQARALGGRVHASSSSSGSTFVVTVPWSEGAPEG